MFGIFEREDPVWVEKLKQERERKLTKIRNKWLETVKYTGILEEDEFSGILSYIKFKTPEKGGLNPEIFMVT